MTAGDGRVVPKHYVDSGSTFLGESARSNAIAAAPNPRGAIASAKIGGLRHEQVTIRTRSDKKIQSKPWVRVGQS